MTVLACIDRSAYASSVCDHAAWAAGRIATAGGEATVHLVHVVDRSHEPASREDLSGNPGIDTPDDLLREIAEAARARDRLSHEAERRLLEAAAARTRAAGISHITQHLLQGELVDELHDHEGAARLIVVGRQGQTADRAPKHLGRNLERVIRATRRPVLITPPEMRPIGQATFAYDGSQSSGAAVRFLVQSRLLAGIRMRVLAVDDDVLKAQDRLADANAQLVHAGIDATAVVRSGVASDAIADQVRDSGSDLLVMGAYGHSQLRQFIVGSTTTAVLRSTSVATLVVR
ncbi:MAG TPA: universal stress protein [Thermomicrobiales bacterium]|jgi:nucleotide-binding universal stress UspA family protein|nr:universal stress protein [Thermomicrobiales bacterium]